MEDHTYEEIRSVAIQVITRREKVNYPPTQFQHYLLGVSEVLERREVGESEGQHVRMSHNDQELAREVFWDLFRQGVITLGSDSANRAFPHFKVTSHGERVLDNQNQYFFHDVSSYRELITSNVPDINEVTLLYLQEALQSYWSGCTLATTVMLGVASEHSLQLLLDAAVSNASYGKHFKAAAKELFIHKKFTRFRNALRQHVAADLPHHITDDLDIQLDGILSVIRTFRNDSGHPSGKIIQREQVYVLLQMFVPYCRRIYELITFFDPPEAEASDTEEEEGEESSE